MAHRTRLGAALVCLLAAACGTDRADPVMTPYALSPPDALVRESRSTTTSSTTSSTITIALSPAEADRRAREALRRAADAADEAFAEHGTYDVDRETIGALAGGLEIVPLEQAAARRGVVYDPFGERVTLHIESSTGRWFCVDLSPAGRDYGFGDTFPDSLATCTDGVQVAGWGDAFSPTGPDEAAIDGVWDTLAAALATGNTAAGFDVFAPARNCSLPELESRWPPGLSLGDPGDLEVEGVIVTGKTASADVRLGPLPAAAWQLRKEGTAWLIEGDPCSVIGGLAAEEVNRHASALLEDALFAVRSVFVVEQDFAFSVRHLEQVNGDLLWVEPDDVAFGLLAYRGTRGAGMVMTAGADGFLCAVESATASTRYGRGDAIDQVATVAACRSGS